MNASKEILLDSDRMTWATQFINSTVSHIFLTGKAGTGKTTFLKNLANRTHKQLAIVAPTGIAALNAGGVTIHSQFLLPFGMFVPDRSLSAADTFNGSFYTPNSLAQKHPLNSRRKQVLRSIDLLVVDEVSMLRADLLDAIDYRLKAVRGNFSQSFGGVQMLFIGDLYQLPPVVKREEEALLKRYYNSPWFFESKALKQDDFVYIELDKIFRQNDGKFIDLLNNLRNNEPTAADIQNLNEHYRTADEIRELKEVITLTTHNYKADELNARALNALESPSRVIHANIEGDFPESMFPVLQRLVLKEGAQIMFTRNDGEDKMYFNGKLATVKTISGDEVIVEMADSHILYTLQKSIWENKHYTIDSSTQEIDDEIIGTFEQYPVKLAWAITVHKSQGLTFDKAIIDVAQAFADGQVYVALSRLRSLDGLIMRTRIDPAVISTDRQIVSFTSHNNHPEALVARMREKQKQYVRHLISTIFVFDLLTKECVHIQRSRTESASLDDEVMEPVLETIIKALMAEKENTLKFHRQLIHLLDENDTERLSDRIRRGTEYYKTLLYNQLKALLTHLEKMRWKKRMKTYITNLVDLEQLFCKKIEELDKGLYLVESILAGKTQFDFSELTAARNSARTRMLEEIQKAVGPPPARKKKGKKKGGESTFEITIRFFKAGLSVREIAEERVLAISTIEAHIIRAIGEGRIPIQSFLEEEKIAIIREAVEEMPKGFTTTDIFKKLEGKFTYNQLRAVMNHLEVTADTGD
jgi:hypothetical protein